MRGDVVSLSVVITRVECVSNIASSELGDRDFEYLSLTYIRNAEVHSGQEIMRATHGAGGSANFIIVGHPCLT